MDARTGRRATLSRAGAGATLLLLGAIPALAGPRDGRWPIDAACVPVGCFNGDAPGYPVEITAPGSYVLTSDLDVRQEPSPEHVIAILVSAAAVDLDLDGFALRGPVTCTSSPAACSHGSGVGVGVLAENGATALRLHDGSIVGFGALGAQLFGDFPALERLRFTDIRSTAVVAFGVGARVEEVVVHRGGGGIFLSGAGSVRDSSVSALGGLGIEAGAAATVESNVVTAIPNFAYAVSVGVGSLVGGNLVANGFQGIRSTGGTLAIGGWSAYSVLWQLDLGPGSGYTAIWMYNSSNLNATGGLSLGQNLCDLSNC